MKQAYNQSFFANKVVDYWIITADRGKKHRVVLMDNNQLSCSCSAKKECYGIKKVREWQNNESKGYQF